MRVTPWPRRRTARSPVGALATLAAIALLAVVAALFWPSPISLSGRAKAIDGDTLRIGETRIRLLGLDAVELDQLCTNRAGAEWPCGDEARAFLAELSQGGPTECAADGHDRYSRVLAHCRINGADVGERIVRAGWAVAELEYGLALTEARLDGRGIWAGRFDDPAKWRRTHGTDSFDFWTWLLGLFGR